MTSAQISKIKNGLLQKTILLQLNSKLVMSFQVHKNQFRLDKFQRYTIDIKLMSFFGFLSNLKYQRYNGCLRLLRSNAVIVNISNHLNMQQDAFQINRYDYYIFLLKQLLFVFKNLNNMGIEMQQLTSSNILIQKTFNQKFQRIKLFYDQRERSYEKNMVSIYNQDSNQFRQKMLFKNFKTSYLVDQNQSENNTFFIQIGLFLLDLIYKYQIFLINKNQLNSRFTVNFELSTYLIIKGDRVCLNLDKINQKIDYLLSLKLVILTGYVNILSSMLINNQNISFNKIIQQINSFEKLKIDLANYDSKIKKSKSVAKVQSFQLIHQKQSSKKIEDSLKYSQASLSSGINQQLPTKSLKTTQEKQFKQSHNDNQSQIKSIKTTHIDSNFYLKLSDLNNIHPKIKQKFLKYVQKLQKIYIFRKDYYDHSCFYGQVDKYHQKRNGQGIYYYYQGDIYFGTWSNNLLIEGTYIFKNGQCFQGTVNKGKQGWGKYYYANGNMYSGQWKNDMKDGKGLMVYENGDSYQGNWLKGKRNGQGIYNYRNGTVYQGNFLNGKKAGYGVIIFSNKTRLEGYWSTNFVQGKGKLVYNNGNIYQGHFCYSEKQGNGTYIWQDDCYYDGQFKNDQMDGQGKVTYSDGQYYQGTIKNGKKQGIGFYHYMNGDQFKGQWQNDQKIEGIYKFKEGNTFQGRFTSNSISYGVMIYSNNQSFQGDFSNGKRHGSGIYRTASGKIIHEGLWENDNPSKPNLN